MDYVATTLGMDWAATVWTVNKRTAVMKQGAARPHVKEELFWDCQSAPQDIPPIPPSIMFHSLPCSPLRNSSRRKSLLVSRKNATGKQPQTQDQSYRWTHGTEDDQATLETVNTDEEEEEMDETSVSTTSHSVSFATPLVTAVHYRPRVETVAEQESLFYTEADYLRFRHVFFQQHARTTRRKVQFAPEIVTDVFCYQSPLDRNKELLFYSEADLQRFLDEFVASLNGVLTNPPPAPAASPKPRAKSSRA